MPTCVAKDTKSGAAGAGCAPAAGVCEPVDPVDSIPSKKGVNSTTMKALTDRLVVKKCYNLHDLDGSVHTQAHAELSQRKLGSVHTQARADLSQRKLAYHESLTEHNLLTVDSSDDSKPPTHAHPCEPGFLK